MRSDSPTPGILALVILATAILTVAKCSAAEYRLRWDVAPASEGVTQWRIYRVVGDGRTLLTTSTTPAATVSAEPGQTLALTAWNGEESEPATLTIPAMVRVTLWRSTNMVDKTPVAEFYFDRKDREFFSLTIDPSRQ